MTRLHLLLLVPVLVLCNENVRNDLFDLQASLEASICERPEHQENAVIERVVTNGKVLIQAFGIKDGSKKEFYKGLLRAGAQNSKNRTEKINEIVELWKMENQSATAQTLMIATYNAEDFILCADSVYNYRKCNKLQEKEFAAALYGAVIDDDYLKGDEETKKRLVGEALEKAKRELKE